MKVYKHFLDGVPLYLARHYWWAYLWPPAVWFFDHLIVINTILFGHYNKLVEATIKHLKPHSNGRILQLACVYGDLTQNICSSIEPNLLHIADVSAVQLQKLKTKNDVSNITASRMTAEALAYRSEAFSTIVIYFLLHEMPAKARRETLSECIRILKNGGELLCTEYAPLPSQHYLYRFPLSRYMLTKLEPFLADYWQEDILTILNTQGSSHGKMVEVISHELLYSGFYRITKFKINSIN